MNIKLKKEDKIFVKTSKQIADIMQRILKRETQISKGREHFWVIGLDHRTLLLYVELISLGTHDSAPVEPMQVYKLALQKNATNIILCHNHTSITLNPSTPDKDHTDKLIQVGKILGIEVSDHIIISPKTKKFFSFANSGLMDELEKSLYFVPKYKQAEAIKRIGKSERTDEMVRTMKKKKMSVELISEITGLTAGQIKKIK